jgi:NOL1/NOP2/fmu family ribosome biogenesis protein
LYFAETGDDRVRLSIEGSQIIGKIATKNILEVDEETAKKWIKGGDIPSEQEFEGFVIIKNGSDFLGCGKYRQKTILNFIPKARRIKGDM